MAEYETIDELKQRIDKAIEHLKEVMKDEIKEIIEYFKDDIDYLEEELKYPNFKGRYITIRDKECEYLRKLLDYITNLQEENKELNDDNIWWNNRFKAVQRNYKDYKSRNDKAIVFIKCGKTFDDIETARIIDKYEKMLLDILQGSDKE